MMLGIFSIYWFSKYMRLLLMKWALPFSVGFVLVFMGCLNWNIHRMCKRKGVHIFCEVSLLTVALLHTSNDVNSINMSYMRLFVPSGKMNSPWVDIVLQLLEMNLASVYNPLLDVLLFHIFIIFKNILNIRLTLDASLEMNVTIRVNIRKR